jgi:hypothetical protein
VTCQLHAGLKLKQNYLGVTEAFHGAKLNEFPYGNGSYFICTLRIVENLEMDPVADRLFANLLNELA